MGLLAAACGEAPFDRNGVAVLEAQAVSNHQSVVVSRVRGPAHFRRLSERRLVVAARFVRQTSGLARRGDLVLDMHLPFVPEEGGYLFGRPTQLTVTYVESGIGDRVQHRYEGGGTVRLEMEPLATGTSARVAISLEVQAVEVTAVVRSITFNGTLATGDNVEQGRAAYDDLGTGIWISSFDPYADVDADFSDFLLDSSYSDSVWATEPSDYYGDYGAFEYSPGGFDDGYDFSDSFPDPDYSDPNFDPSYDTTDVTDCGGSLDEGESEGYDCASNAGDDAAGCGGTDETSSSCDSGGEGPDCEGGSENCSTLTRGPTRTLVIVLLVLFIARWRRRSRSAS